MVTRVTAVVALLLLVLPGPMDADAIPAFARRYRTSCSTCHTAAPKLNPLGEAFRLNGYRFPFNDKLIREENPVSLGAEPWKDLWPRAIWPGELAESVRHLRRARRPRDVRLRRSAHHRDHVRQ